VTTRAHGEKSPPRCDRQGLALSFSATPSCGVLLRTSRKAGTARQLAGEAASRQAESQNSRLTGAASAEKPGRTETSDGEEMRECREGLGRGDESLGPQSRQMPVSAPSPDCAGRYPVSVIRSPIMRIISCLVSMSPISAILNTKGSKLYRNQILLATQKHLHKFSFFTFCG
jgi:hypothetical protein